MHLIFLLYVVLIVKYFGFLSGKALKKFPYDDDDDERPDQ